MWSLPISVSLSGVAARTVLSTALLVFGALITPARVAGAWAVAVPAIVLIRPAAMALSLIRTRAATSERAVVAWFGPKASPPSTGNPADPRAGSRLSDRKWRKLPVPAGVRPRRC